MYELPTLVVLIAILAVLIATFVLKFIDFYSAGAMEDVFSPENIQAQLQEAMTGPTDADIAKHEGNAEGGVNRSAALRMKDFDKIIGEGMIGNLDPTIKSALSMVFPDAEAWIERNPDLAAKAMQKLQPFLQGLMGGQGQSGNNSGPQNRRSWY